MASDQTMTALTGLVIALGKYLGKKDAGYNPADRTLRRFLKLVNGHENKDLHPFMGKAIDMVQQAERIHDEPTYWEEVSGMED